MNIRKRRSDRSGRVPLFSQVAAVAGREERRRFWAAIAAGTVSEDAAVGAGVPQAVGTRWFRKAGGMLHRVWAIGEAALWSVSLFCGAGRDRAASRSGLPMQEVARRLGRVVSTISRELRRNAATRSGGLEYRATTAQWHAERAARRPKQAKLERNAALRTMSRNGWLACRGSERGSCPAGRVWKSRRHGPRKEARATRSRSDAARGGLPGRRDHAHQP